MYSQDDLPKNVVRTLNQGSNVMTLDFHPVQQTILLGLSLSTAYCAIAFFSPGQIFNSFTFLAVGTNVGDIGIWEVGSRERIAHKTFKVWDVSACSLPLQVLLFKFVVNL
jgi:hypothetical protein